MVHTRSNISHAEREKLAVNLEQHRQMQTRLLEAVESVRRLQKQAAALQQEAQRLVAQSREVKRDP